MKYLLIPLFLCSGCAATYQTGLRDEINQRQIESQQIVDSLIGQTKKHVLQRFGPPQRTFNDGDATVYVYQKSLGYISDTASLDMGYGMAYGTGASQEVVDCLNVYFEKNRVYKATCERN